MVLAPLVILAAAFFVLALAFVIEDMIKNVANVVRGIQVVGGYLAGALDSIARAITSAAGAIMGGIDHLIGATWHLFATYLDRTFNQLEAHSSVIAHLAELVGKGIYSITGLRALVHGAVRTIHGIEHGVKTLERDFKGIEHDVRTIEKSLAHGIGNDVLPRLRTLEREVGKVENVVIPGIRGIANTAENEVTALRKWITANMPLASTLTFAGAVAWALGSLGLGALRCRGFTNLLGKWGCGLGGLLDALLGLAISALALESVCATLPILETAFGDVVGPITHLLTEVPLGGCETPPAGWASLSVKMGPVPPPQTLGALPV